MASEEYSIGARISRVVWDRDDKSEEERRFVRRLDLGLMTIACLGYFVKYLDQSNVANAYVSGMEEDLHFKGDEYNTLLTMFTVGYVIGQYPGTLFMVQVSPAIWLPCCEVVWTVLAMCCSVAENVHTLYAIRFLMGIAEATAYPGSWYGPSELGKRAVLFICCSSAGTMFSGYLQAAAYTGLDGVGGRAGWQWLFLIDGIISLPIAALGFILIPNTPDRVNPLSRLHLFKHTDKNGIEVSDGWWLRDKDIALANERVRRFNRAPRAKFTIKGMISAFKSWIPWTFFFPYTCFVLGLNSYAYMNLWLKSTDTWSVAQINVIPTGGYALQIFMALIYSWVSDALRMRWPVIAFGAILALIGNIILAIWPVSDPAKFAGFYLSFTVVGCGALMLSWANELTSYSAEHRAITIGFLNTASYVFNAWVPNVVFPAAKAPHYPAGYKVTAVFFAIMFLGTLVNAILAKRLASAAAESITDAEAAPESEEESVVDEKKL
ncbi:MFS general substrate transporter [Fistulina hepatica ATCC 64428]|uniref:MFS general substrate transporter n=1 Tax=Fistulina hepatica ATCC 64428 TaxID=1128425 RepID=A0A0D7AFZ2_9AGAR|nr:MFS general substrate transporter [Fistulina hepatica ATCC 64428]